MNTLVVIEVGDWVSLRGALMITSRLCADELVMISGREPAGLVALGRQGKADRRLVVLTQGNIGGGGFSVGHGLRAERGLLRVSKLVERLVDDRLNLLLPLFPR